MNKNPLKKRHERKHRVNWAVFIVLFCIVVLTVGIKILSGKGSVWQMEEKGAVLSSAWKEMLNQETVQQWDVRKIVFLDLAEEDDAVIDDAIGKVCYPKDDNESSKDSGDLYMWVQDINGQYVLYLAAEGGVWAPKDSSRLFYDMESVEEIEFNEAFHTEYAISMKEMFDCCVMVKSLDVSSFDTSRVEDMSFMFATCERLADLDVTSWDTSQVKNMRSMFINCESLTEVDLSSFDTENVKDMTDMFWGCSNLKSVGDLAIPENADPNGTTSLEIH